MSVGRTDARSSVPGRVILHIRRIDENDLSRGLTALLALGFPFRGWVGAECVHYVGVIGNCVVVGRHRILSIIRIERVHRVDDLGEIVFRLRLSGLVLNCFESGKEQADQNRNDSDDNEQLDQSEARVRCGRCRAFDSFAPALSPSRAARLCRSHPGGSIL